MGKFGKYIGSQFSNPRGLVGFFCCRIMDARNKKMYNKIISLMGENLYQKILDIGYGNGFMIKNLDKNFLSEIYGIGFSEKMEKTLLKKNGHAESRNKINLFAVNCSSLPFGDDFFDAVTSVNSIYFWDDTLKSLQEIYRCMKNGTSFYNAAYTKEWLDSKTNNENGLKKFEPVELIVLGRKAGFEKVLIHEIVHRKSFVVEYRKSTNSPHV